MRTRDTLALCRRMALICALALPMSQVDESRWDRYSTLTGLRDITDTRANGEPGTYLLSVCARRCVLASDVLLKIKLILWGGDVPIQGLSASQREQVERRHRVVLDRSEPPNACFIVFDVHDHAWGRPADTGFTRWSRRGADLTRIELYHGPDGGYWLNLKLSASVTGGRATSWSAYPGGVYSETAYAVVGRREGGPHAAACTK